MTTVDAKAAKQSDSTAANMRAMHNHTKHMTDEQVKLALSWLNASLRERAAAKAEVVWPGQCGSGVTVRVLCILLLCGSM